MIDVKRFGGVLNRDDLESDVLPIQHIDAKNIRFYGGSNGLTAQNIRGNFKINNSDLPAGTNENCGAFFDSVKKRILWFNYNSNGNHGLYQLSVQTGQVTQIFRCGVHSATDILRLNLDYPIHSMAIVYRTTGDGDLLYWTDGNTVDENRPRYLNLDTVATLAPFTESMINAAKNAPLSPPVLDYEDDATVNVNNFQKKLFRGIYRWAYKNGEKSTWSPISKVPLPSDGYNPNIQNDPTKNNNIKIPVVGGGADFKKIEIAGQFNINNVWGDFFLIDTLDKDDYNIATGGTYNYYFYNNGSYPSVDVEETDLYYSWLPDYANTLELLNGNVLIYGGLTDGYDKLARVNIDVTVTSGLSTGSGVPSISYNRTSAHILTVNIGSVVTNGTVYTISFIYENSLGVDSVVLNKTAVVPTDTQQDIVNYFVTQLNATLDINAVDNGGGIIVITDEFSSGSGFGTVSISISSSGAENAAAAWKWSCSERLGIIYFDDRGKTNGVISFVGDPLDTTDFSVTTPAFNVISNITQVPFLAASINHAPPTWAVSYQWVRANLLPTTFIYWVTNDYQTDADYLYIGIQNLVYQGTQNTGFVPSYDFSDGDRLRVMAAYTGGNYVPYNLQLDFEVLGAVQRPMTSPVTPGTFLKVAKPTTLPSAAYQTAMFIEIYTPSNTAANKKQVFYEWGEKYSIYTLSGVRRHRGQLTDQTAAQPATFQWFDGDVYYKSRRFYTVVNSTTTASNYTMDANYNDYFVSAVNSNGRGWVIDDDAKQEYNQVLSRWGGSYQPGTNINSLNKFRPNDFDEADRAKGDIRRYKARDRILRVFQDRGVGQYGIYARFIQNNEGVPELVTTNEIITTNNLQYYQGQFGLGGYPTNLCSSTIADYFVDVVTGREVRLSGDGMTDLGMLYKGQFYLSGLVTPYNKVLRRSNGKIAKVMKFWDSFDNQAHTVLQAGRDVSAGAGAALAFTFNQSISDVIWGLAFSGVARAGDVVKVVYTDLSGTTTFNYVCSEGQLPTSIRDGLITLINVSVSVVATPVTHGGFFGLNITYNSIISQAPVSVVATLSYSGIVTADYNYSFNETRNAFCSFYDYIPEWAISANDIIYSWKDGEIWKHDGQNYYCEFYGVKYGCHITVVFNQNILQKKSWQSITEIASDTWDAPVIYTNLLEYPGQRQETNLVQAEFVKLEQNPTASIKRSATSRGGKIGGSFVKGNWAVIKFQKQNAQYPITLSQISLSFVDSPLTTR